MRPYRDRTRDLKVFGCILQPCALPTELPKENLSVAGGSGEITSYFIISSLYSAHG